MSDESSEVAVAGSSAQDRYELAVLPGWRDTDLFTPRERAALDLTEAVTLLAQQHPDDADLRESARCSPTTKSHW